MPRNRLSLENIDILDETEFEEFWIAVAGQLVRSSVGNKVDRRRSVSAALAGKR